MAKRATLELEFKPKHVEYFGDYFVIIYDQKAITTSAAAAEEEDYLEKDYDEARGTDFSGGKQQQ